MERVQPTLLVSASISDVSGASNPPVPGGVITDPKQAL
jgi:hypothetical protein